MGLPGVIINIQNGNLNLQPASAEQTMIYLGCCTGGTPNVLTFYSDAVTLATNNGIGAALEAVAYAIDNAGGPVGLMPLAPDTQGGVSSVTHNGTGSGTVALTLAPHVTIEITCTTLGTLGTAQFTFKLGSAAASQPVTSASSWSSTGYLVPGTYCNIVFTAGSYTTSDVYTITSVGGITHTAGAGPAVPSYTASPLDDYTPVITVTTGGAVGAAQITYALDGGAYTAPSTSPNTSAAIITSSPYAIPNTGIVLTLGSTFVAGDTYSFSAAGPRPSGTALAAGLTALKTTYVSSSYSMAAILQGNTTGSDWVTQAGTLETAALALNQLGVFMRFFAAVPTTGSISGNSGSITVDSTDSDSALITDRASVSAPHVPSCAGDGLMVQPISNLLLRRNAIYASAMRAAEVEASRNIGDVSIGALPGWTSLFRNEATTPALDAAGFITLRTYPGNINAGTGLPGFFITDGHTMDVSTSDYYPLANARVIDRASTITLATSLPFVNSKIPTTTRNGQSGVITLSKAGKINEILFDALNNEMVDNSPQDAVAVNAQVNLTHDILSDGNLIIAVNVQPFAYSRTITVNLGLTVAA